ncbi:MAG: hypothetical protein EZS28_000883 [Streblomastix strix]|uniref:Uncharacterized protein n=1 Tax=Streblomastix strix TaxID=222440 RepID=A0A5J4X8L5_9EUKA|nr:MAG: hypothetical protein EZS28_000883 [Streblomastix strix]
MDSLRNLIFSLCVPIRFDTPHPLFKQLSACYVREIKDIRIRRQIIQHIITMYDNHDGKENGLGSIAFNCLSLNPVNLDEILKGDFLVQIRDTLTMEIKGNEKQRKFLFDKLERKCIILKTLLNARQDDEFKVLIIDIGIIDALLKIYATYDFKLLTQVLTSIIKELLMYSKYKSIKQFISRNPYPALIRLLDHPNGQFPMICIFFIHNLLSCAINETNRTALHPHYDIIASCDGIQKIYSQFKRNAFFLLRDVSAICIGIRQEELSHSWHQMMA